MDNYDVFQFDLEYEDKSGSKLRPVAVKEIALGKTDIVGIYSYRKWFDGNDGFYEIIDIEEAGLNRRSFVKLTEIVSLDDVQPGSYEIIGHLSDRDIEGLMQAIENLDN